MSEQDRVRLDKWLWAARFYKTRGLAKEAIESGKVRCCGVRCKPAKEVRIGQELTLRTGWDERTLIVEGLSDVRGKAVDAQALYRETEESCLKRQQAAEQRKAQGGGALSGGARPTKKQRRQLYYLRGGSGEFRDE